MPNPSVDARTTAYNSDSPELFATTAWVLEYDLIKWDHSIIVPPDVDLRSRLHPAQFASEVSSTVTMSLYQQNFHINLGLPFKYLPTLFNMSQPRTLGLDIIRQMSLTAYCMSGLSGCKSFQRAAIDL